MSREDDLDQFARALMQHVRDPAIEEMDAIAAGRTLDSPRWAQLLGGAETARLVQRVIPEIVDQVLFELLDRIDNRTIELALQGDGSRTAPLSELGKGEMAGWLVGSDGWRHRYSAQRFYDSSAEGDVQLEFDDE